MLGVKEHEQEPAETSKNRPTEASGGKTQSQIRMQVSPIFWKYSLQPLPFYIVTFH